MTLATRVMSTLIAGLGIAMIAVAIERGDVVRGVVGVLFVVAGAGRLYLQGRA